MFDIDFDSLDHRQTLALLAEMKKLAEHAESTVIAAAAHWADLNSVVQDDRALPGAERLVRLGGDGTPEVAEFCTAEPGALLALPIRSADRLIADALDLRHRLPRLWARVAAGEVKPWIARQLADATRPLSAEHADAIDRVIAPYADRRSLGSLLNTVEAEAMRLDPRAARKRAEQAAKAQGVFVSPSSDHGTKEILIKTETPYAILFDAQIDRIADDLKLLGDESAKDIRRGRAVGVIANPQHALDLRFDAMRAAGHQGPAPAKSSVDARPPVTLYVHLTDAALASGEGVARIEGHPPVTVDQIRSWLGHCHVTVKPVIDLNNQAPADAYEIPDRLREAVHLMSPRDCFPYGANLSRRKDVDHSIPYRDDGTPAQTAIGNLGPLSRRPHRIRTHGRWDVRQPFPGIFLWRSPHGLMYLVDHTGTRPIANAA